MPRTDPRVVRTRAALHGALLDLASENPAEIGVTALCEKSGLSRGTFYLHYPDVDSLAADVAQTLVQEIVSVWREVPPDDTADFSERSRQFLTEYRQGIVLGLDGWQLVFLVAAAITLLIGVSRFGPPGLLYTAPLYLGLGATALVTVQGLSAPQMLGLWLSKQVRHGLGATAHRYRPERTQLAGTLNLPGSRASVQLWEAEGMASVYHPHERTVSITAELEVQGFLMRDAPERMGLAQQWSPVLAALTQRPGIKRVTLQERTTRTTIRPARDHYEHASRKRLVDTEGPAVANYEDVLDGAERFAVGHRNYLTLTLDLVALGAQLKALGGGRQAIQALAAVEAGNLAEALSAAKITVRTWLSPREVAELARTAFDPDSIPVLRNRTEDRVGVDPAATTRLPLAIP